MSKYDKMLSYLNNLSEPVKKSKIYPRKKNVTQVNNFSFEDINQPVIIYPEETNKRQIFKNYFESFKIDSLILPKLFNEFEQRGFEKIPSIEKNELILCIRKLYYLKHLDYPKFESEDIFKNIKTYIGENIIGYINEVLKPKIQIKIQNDIKVSTMYIIVEVELEESELNNIYFIDFYNQGIIYSYLLNKYPIYNISNTNVIFYVKNLNRFLIYNKKNNTRKVENYFQNLLIFQKCFNDNKIPDILNSNKNQCLNCKYETFCKKDSLNIILKDNRDTKDKPTFLM